MNYETLKIMQQKIDAHESGALFDVQTLMGEHWQAVSSKQSFGRLFKKAIANGNLINVQHDHLAHSPRRDIYRKTRNT